MKRGGLRLNLVVVTGLLALVVAGVLLALGEYSPEAAGEEFMRALAKKDVDKLVELSYLESPIEPVRAQWDFCVNQAAKNFIFMWEWLGSWRRSDDECTLTLVLMEFHMEPVRGPVGSESEPVQLPLVRRDGKWKVDLASLTRRFFPALPR